MFNEENVKRGISLLDEKVPNWRDRINWETLNIACFGNCVLGQLFGDYFYGWEELVAKSGVPVGYHWGFDMSPGYDMSEGYRQLTETWKALAKQ